LRDSEVTYIDVAFALHNLKLLLHGFLHSASLVPLIAPLVYHLQLLLPQTFAAVVVPLDLHKNLVLLVVISAHDPFNDPSFLVSVLVQDFLLDHKFLHSDFAVIS